MKVKIRMIIVLLFLMCNNVYGEGKIVIGGEKGIFEIRSKPFENTRYNLIWAKNRKDIIEVLKKNKKKDQEYVLDLTYFEEGMTTSIKFKTYADIPDYSIKVPTKENIWFIKYDDEQ